MNGPIEPITRLTPQQGLRRVERHPRPADEREAPRDRVELARPDDNRLWALMLHILADSLEEPQISAEARQAETPETARDLASWLLQAINGVLIYDFLESTARPAPEVFDYFLTEIRADLESGAIEVEEILQSLGAFDDAGRRALHETMALVEDALERFGREAAQELRLNRRLELAIALRGA